MKIRMVIFLLLLSGLSIGCNGSGSANAETPLPESIIETLFSSQYTTNGAASTKQSIVIVDQSNFESELIWYTDETAPLINFEENKVLILSMGTRNTGGYSISIDNSMLLINDNSIILKVLYTEPSEDCVVTQAITNPYLILRIPTQKEVLVNVVVKFFRTYFQTIFFN